MKRFFKFLFSAAPETISVTLSDIEAARSRISAYVPSTPLTHSAPFSESTGRQVLFKWDNKLRTGSFKERGATNFLLSLTEKERARGVCTASAGNHALGLSHYSRILGIKCHLVMPRFTPLVKIEANRKNDAEIILHGDHLSEAIVRAQALTKEKGLIFVPPYDHPHIIAGQGVSALEALESVPEFDSIIVPIGGGGYISGIATAIKAKRPDVFVLGACSEWAINARDGTHGSQAIVSSSIADGIAVKTIGEHTAPIIEKVVDEIVRVSESEIASAVVAMLELEHTLVEGSGAVSLAALLKSALPEQYRRPLLFVSGSNIDSNLLGRLIEREMASRDRILRIHASIPDRPGSLHKLTGVLAENGANILQVFHDRSYTKLPANVEVTLMVEVKNRAHKEEIVCNLSRVGVDVRILDQS